jgi:hypothetical protein
VDWTNEPYVKVYTRETDDDLLLSWEARALWAAMMVKFDRSGLLETKRGRKGLAALVRIPPEVVERALPELLEDGRVTEILAGFFARNFMAAQEASKSDKLRQRESRVKRATLARESSIGANTDVTNRDQTSRAVTSGHAASQPVTLCSADPIPLQGLPLHAVTGAPPFVTASPDADPEISRPRALAPEQQRPTAQVRDLALERRQRLRTATFARLNRVRAGIAGEFNMVGVKQVYPQGLGERDLADRILESGADAEANCDHVLACAEAAARGGRTVKWLTGSLFGERQWRRMLGTTPAEAFADADREWHRHNPDAHDEPQERTLVCSHGDPDLETP